VEMGKSAPPMENVKEMVLGKAMESVLVTLGMEVKYATSAAMDSTSPSRMRPRSCVPLATSLAMAPARAQVQNHAPSAKMDTPCTQNMDVWISTNAW